jgi:hypothetical protein
MNKVISKILLLLLNLNLQSSTLAQQSDAIGTRIDLTPELKLNSGQFAQLFIPDYFISSSEDKFTLLFHLHSASWAAENMIYQSRINAILFNIHLGPFSSWYGIKYFSDTTKFQHILNTIHSKLEKNGILVRSQIDYLILTSFSAGYAGVREILKVNSYYDQINVLILADGLHCDLDSSIARTQMNYFLSFAEDACEGKKIMLITHSSIPTDGYQSTTETANYLIERLSLKLNKYQTSDEIGTRYAKCDTGKFHLRSYFGDTAGDHLKHLYGMDKMLKFINKAISETR